MADNRRYWTEKRERATEAAFHVKCLHENYEQELQKEYKDTIVYSKETHLDDGQKGSPVQMFLNADSVSAVFQMAKENPKSRIAVLNFASYKHPGGMYLEGSKAQEECLCTESSLYPVLEMFKDSYYAENSKNLNRALYADRALYTQGILFARTGEKMVKADVLTCAAPNFSAASKYAKVSKEENSKVLEQRIKFVKEILQTEDAVIWILGAWGCGVFGQDPSEVAELFDKHCKDAACEKIVYAVPGNDATAETFRKRFE